MFQNREVKENLLAVLLALLAAALYAISVPLSKLLLERMGSVFLSSFLYLGAGIGIGIMYLFTHKKEGAKSERLTKKELPYTVGMIALDIAAPILLMIGLKTATAANVSLLNNFEIAATSLIALFIFKELISKRVWFAIGLITIASMLLSFEDMSSFRFSTGSLFVLGACVCWGFENNCTKRISNKSSVEIVVIKGCCSGLGSLLIALLLGENIPALGWVLAVLVLGFVSYGLSIHFYIMAQKDLGAAKTSAYYSIAPFLGVLFGMLLLGETPGIQFYVALAIMVVSTVLMVKDTMSA